MSKLNNTRNTKAQFNTGTIDNPVDTLYPKLSIEYLDLKDNVLQKEEKLNVFKCFSIVLKNT